MRQNKKHCGSQFLKILICILFTNLLGMMSYVNADELLDGELPPEVKDNVLNEDCTVSVLGRTSTITPDGTFVVPNLPAGDVLVKARVICQRGEGLLGGESGFFRVNENEEFAVGVIDLGTIPPSVELLSVTGGESINVPGSTDQLLVVADLSDGSTQDVTQESQGTTYTSSNSSIASVDNDGLVTAGNQSGTAFISILNDGVFAAKSLTVSGNNDNDGDGLPNDYELLFGLDPNNPNDANFDPDGDGLTNLEEFNQGTLINNSDTDGDGLGDGTEIAQGSNPLFPDSDLDGVLDGNEPPGDFDGDGIINALDPDSDNDGLGDGVEVALSGSITGANPFADADGDGLSNLDEVAFSTDPNNPDSDGDGLTDGEEVFAGLDPLIADSTPPTVAISTPTSGQDLVEGETFNVMVGATDDGLVTAVDLLLNGNLIGTDNTQPFEFPLLVPSGFGSVELEAVAFDTNNNSATTAGTFNVIPDPLTTVIGLVLDEDGFPADGATATVRMPGDGVVVVENDDTFFVTDPFLFDPETGMQTSQLFEGTMNFVPGNLPLNGQDVDLAPANEVLLSGTLSLDLAILGPGEPINATMNITGVNPATGLTFTAVGGGIVDNNAFFDPSIFETPLTFGLQTTSFDNGNVTTAEPLVTQLPQIMFTGTFTPFDLNDPFVGGLVFGETEWVVPTAPDFMEIVGPDGIFEFASVPTINGDLIVDGELEVTPGEFLSGRSIPTSPVRGGVTDVGQVTLGPVDLYSIARGDNFLRRIDPLDATTVSSVPITLGGSTVNGGTGLATNPITREMYALLRLSGQQGRELVTIDTDTGVATSVGNTGTGMAGLAFDSNGTLYGISGDGANPPETLFTLDKTDASLTLILPLGRGSDGETIAFNPDDGHLYHASGHTGNDVIFELINIDTLNTTDIPLSGNDLVNEEAQALVYWRSESAFLWKQDHGTGPLFRVTPTGSSTLIGNMDHQSKGLAFR